MRKKRIDQQRISNLEVVESDKNWPTTADLRSGCQTRRLKKEASKKKTISIDSFTFFRGIWRVMPRLYLKRSCTQTTKYLANLECCISYLINCHELQISISDKVVGNHQMKLQIFHDTHFGGSSCPWKEYEKDLAFGEEVKEYPRSEGVWKFWDRVWNHSVEEKVVFATSANHRQRSQNDQYCITIIYLKENW